MYAVKIESRGPEGVQCSTQYRLSEAGSAELQKRIQQQSEAGDVALDALFAGIELEQVKKTDGQAAAEPPAAGKKRGKASA